MPAVAANEDKSCICLLLVSKSATGGSETESRECSNGCNDRVSELERRSVPVFPAEHQMEAVP